ETALDAYAHQDLPFERLVEELAPERSLAVSPLFQATFALQNAPRQALSLPELALEVVPSESGQAKFDLSFTLIEDAEGGVSGALDYAADLFDPPTVRRLLASYERLLAGLVEAPGRRLSELSLLTPAEDHLLLREWNDTASRQSEPVRPAHEWIAEVAARFPEAVALIHGTERRTYAEMERQAARLARRLVAASVGPERIVGICLEPSCDLIVAMLGVWKAGGAYLPLDPGYPAERLAYMVADSGVEIVIGGSEGMLPGSVRCMEIQEDGEPAEEISALPSGLDVDHLAYVIYTSGSTGRPKGVAVTHRGLGNLIASERRTFDLAPGDRALLFASFSFDASVYDILAPLGCGAAVVLADRMDRMPGPGLVRLLAEQEVTWAVVTPSALAAVPAAELPKLAILGVGSEACPAELVSRWAPGRRFFNLYGPTEMTAVCVTQEWTEEGAPPIGRPILNSRAHVLDRWLAPAPLGAEGELYLTGPGIARGYLGRPDLTAERFLPDPWSPMSGEGGGRLYRTGDRVRLRPDGRIDYLGRIDHQVKIRGFRIELGEIEAALVAIPGVREAAVLVREPRPGDRRLAAYVVGGPGLAAAALRAELEKRLPEHMVPAAFAFVESFPLTPSRKLDRAALAKIEPERSELTDPISPRTPAEEILAGIWSEVLGVERIGVND
ncbi:MAG TPA: amino acid adenylation domain-containing protein, partial [Thermoanaerobaculia bacterium]|nr:amino acid adenylation domain-containing protein [Thermoanaerobaculia bacterium]